jgi:hypothetical protein
MPAPLVLIDLSMQPSNIRTIINDVIEEAMVANKDVSQVGIRLMKFCHLYDLKRITDQAQAYAEPLNARYNTV